MYSGVQRKGKQTSDNAKSRKGDKSKRDAEALGRFRGWYRGELVDGLKLMEKNSQKRASAHETSASLIVEVADASTQNLDRTQLID